MRQFSEWQPAVLGHTVRVITNKLEGDEFGDDVFIVGEVGKENFELAASICKTRVIPADLVAASSFKYICPCCSLSMNQHPNESYMGEMWLCQCDFQAYFDEFNSFGVHTTKQEPF